MFGKNMLLFWIYQNGFIGAKVIIFSSKTLGKQHFKNTIDYFAVNVCRRNQWNGKYFHSKVLKVFQKNREKYNKIGSSSLVQKLLVL